ncbi:regulatory protein abaA [Podospora conica]|nr:regulatory protein abaA [Schizothecium conicum]
MEHQLRLPILPSQCYSSSSDYMLESSHGNHGEQLGRIPPGYARRSRNHSPITPSILTPPIVPTQALGSTYRSPLFTRVQERHESHLHLRQQQSRGRAASVNPIALYPGFSKYRERQNQKEPDANKGQKWPELLEDAFLNALLLIPHIGRTKFVVQKELSGRNMLIAAYVWQFYLRTLPPGVVPSKKEKRGRKQVSSHIQVLKGIFKNHRACHIILPREVKGKCAALPSLKAHPVLVALSNDEFPLERPNYEYFARVFELDELIAIRPKRCWIFVVHKDVVVAEDGSGQVRGTGQKLARHQYPHLRRNFEREKWSKEELRTLKGGSLVHEYTKQFNQVESGTVRELSAQWKGPFPDFHRQLEGMIAANAREDIITAEARCDIIHMHVTLEGNTKKSFPADSELNSWVEINIEKPHLLGHRWKVQTRLVRPPELAYSDDKSTPQPVYEVSAEIPIQYKHQPNCVAAQAGADARHCVSPQCRGRDNRSDYVNVPFPADICARTLINCGQFPAHPPTKEVKIVKTYDDKNRKNTNRKPREPKVKTLQMILPGRTTTQMDLVPRIAMMQELFSCAPASPQDHESGSAAPRWTRRGLILWSFQTLHSVGTTGDEKGALLTAAGGGTNWRFLTILDPMSEYHLQRSLLPPSSTGGCGGDDYRDAMAGFAAASRDMVMSPNPPYQEHLNASMSENFGAAAYGLDDAAQAAYEAHMLAQHQNAATTSAPSAYPILAGYGGGGLATPPPTASLASSFATSFDGHQQQAGPGSYMAPPAGMDDAGLSFGAAPPGYGAAYGEIHEQAWDAAGAWSAGGYVAVPAPVGHWERQHHHQHHHQEEQHWAAAPEDAAAAQMWRPSPPVMGHVEHGHHQHHGHHQQGYDHDGTPPPALDGGWIDIKHAEGSEDGSSMGTRSWTGSGSGTVTPRLVKEEEEEEEDGDIGDEDLSREWEEVVGEGGSLAVVHQFQGHHEGMVQMPVPVGGGRMGEVGGGCEMPRGVKRGRDEEEGEEGLDEGGRRGFVPMGRLRR